MKHILNQYIDLLKEKEETENRINKINGKLTQLNLEGNVKDAVKGGMGNMQTYHIEGFPTAKEDELKYQLNRLKDILKVRESDITDKLNEVEEWLNTLDDVRMRRMIIKRFKEGKSWAMVAMEMGDKYTEDSCKKQFERFMKAIDNGDIE